MGRTHNLPVVKRVLLVNPYAAGSHALWEKGWLEHVPRAAAEAGVELDIRSIGLPGRHWKWRMQASAWTLVRRLEERGDLKHPVDAFLVTDMMDVGQFRAALPEVHRGVPIVLYFHENQLTFPEHPERPNQEWDRHYAWMNLTSALLADAVWFNSNYHRQAFLEAIPGFLKGLPTPRPAEAGRRIESKSLVVPIGIEDDILDGAQSGPRVFGEGAPIIAWNHRWEYDKGPQAFLEALLEARRRGHRFRLAVMGQSFGQVPASFDDMKAAFSEDIVHWGHAPTRSEYVAALASCDIALVTAHHDFFGISVLESAGAGLTVLAPRELAYSEHFGREALFDRNALTEALCSALATLPENPWRNAVQKYRWENVAQKAWVALNRVWRGVQ